MSSQLGKKFCDFEIQRMKIMNRPIDLLKRNTTFTTVLILTILYIINVYLFGNRIGIVEIILTILINLYFVWGFNLQFWKIKRDYSANSTHLKSVL